MELADRPCEAFDPPAQRAKLRAQVLQLQPLEQHAAQFVAGAEELGRSLGNTGLDPHYVRALLSEEEATLYQPDGDDEGGDVVPGAESIDERSGYKMDTPKKSAAAFDVSISPVDSWANILGEVPPMNDKRRSSICFPIKVFTKAKYLTQVQLTVRWNPNVVEDDVPFHCGHRFNSRRVVILLRPPQKLGGPIQPSEGFSHLGPDVRHLDDGRDHESPEKDEGDQISWGEPAFAD